MGSSSSSSSSHFHHSPTLDEEPPANAEKEPMLLLDTTGSMAMAVSPTDSTPRKDVIREAIGIIVKKLGEQDSQAEHEEGGGGLRTVTFADGHAKDIDDLNPKNLKEKWDKIKWVGGTHIMPGWKAMHKAYMEEFGSRPVKDRPIMMALVITDGEAVDGAILAEDIKTIKGYVFVTFAILGYGADHDACLASYKKIEAENSHVKVLTFESETNPEVIASALLKMIQ